MTRVKFNININMNMNMSNRTICAELIAHFSKTLLCISIFTYSRQFGHLQCIPIYVRYKFDLGRSTVLDYLLLVFL